MALTITNWLFLEYAATKHTHTHADKYHRPNNECQKKICLVRRQTLEY